VSVFTIPPTLASAESAVTGGEATCQTVPVQRIASGQTHGGERETLTGLGQTMRDASLCGLGQTAASALLSAIDKGLVVL